MAALKRYKTTGADQSIAKGGKNHDIYIVRRGDNLAVIAKRIGVSARTIMKVNGLRRGRIHPGQRLKYYPPTAQNGEGSAGLLPPRRSAINGRMNKGSRSTITGDQALPGGCAGDGN